MDQPDFRSPGFLRAHIARTMDFYHPRCIDPAGGFFHYFKDELNADIKLRHSTQARVVCMFPERRLFNTDKMALEFIRRPHRQYKRGICKENVSIYSPVRHLWGVENYPWTHKTLQHALYPVYPKSAQEAIEKLQKKEVVSIALNDKFMLTLSITRGFSGFYLWYCNKCIGVLCQSVQS